MLAAVRETLQRVLHDAACCLGLRLCRWGRNCDLFALVVHSGWVVVVRWSGGHGMCVRSTRVVGIARGEEVLVKYRWFEEMEVETAQATITLPCSAS